MIEYRKYNKTDALGVYLDGIRIGEIRVVSGGFQYFPRGQKIGGDIFPTLAEVKRSLETEAEK